VTVLFLGACGIAGNQVWQSFFRYRAYGTVEGRLLELSPPWDGAIAFAHVREGDTVRQGQVLLTLDNPELQHQLAQVEDDLLVAKANLEAETVKLRWQLAFHLDETTGAAAASEEARGQLLAEQAQLERMAADLDRARRVHAGMPGAVEPQALDRLRYDRHGQEGKVARLRDALAERGQRAHLADTLLGGQGDLAATAAEDGRQQLQPFLARITALQRQRGRLRERLAQGRVCAPANGVVVRLCHFPGERCRPAEPVLELLEEGSLRIALYLPQDASTDFAVGADVDLVLEPYPQPLTCNVTRFGDRYEQAPESIKRHYAVGQALLPVYLRPRPEAARWTALCVGGVVKLPRGPRIPWPW
jgi:multidrug resistance efflux pump